MKATLIVRERAVYPDGSVVEMVAWHVATPVPPSRHRYKYRFAYIIDGKRVLGYDNERGKGDHRHDGTNESSVSFTTLAALTRRFLSDVEKMRRIR